MIETISDIVFDHLRRKIMARAETPSAAEITAALNQAGHPDITWSQVSHASRHLADCGRLLKTGSSGRNSVVWSLPVGRCRTVPRSVRLTQERTEKERQQREEASAAAKAAAASYDAAVASREFAKHEMRVKRGPYQFYADRRVQPCSLTGCSAAECAL